MTFSASGIEADTYTGTITAKEAVVIMDGEGEEAKDVTANYKIEVENGTLTISKTDVELTVTLAGATHVYDGETYSLTAATTNAASGTTTIEYSADGENWTADLSSLTATTVADSKTIQVRATNPNYKNTATGKTSRRPMTTTLPPIPT